MIVPNLSRKKQAVKHVDRLKEDLEKKHRYSVTRVRQMNMYKDTNELWKRLLGAIKDIRGKDPCVVKLYNWMPFHGQEIETNFVNNRVASLYNYVDGENSIAFE